MIIGYKKNNIRPGYRRLLGLCSFTFISTVLKQQSHNDDINGWPKIHYNVIFSYNFTEQKTHSDPSYL